MPFDDSILCVVSACTSHCTTCTESECSACDEGYFVNSAKACSREYIRLQICLCMYRAQGIEREREREREGGGREREGEREKEREGYR